MARWFRFVAFRRKMKPGNLYLVRSMRIPEQSDHDSWVIPITIPA
jgi:hypothetical protein